MRPVVARSLLAAVVAIAAGGLVVADRAVERPSNEQSSGSSGGADVAGLSTDDPLAPLPVLADSAPAVAVDRWLNTEPLTAADLAGRVVLYQFWTFGCVNCRNVLPHVRAWHARYASDGLVVVSIHTPEFAYEADVDAIRGFVEDNDVRFPVALDPDRETWRSFDNHYWPAFYLHDREGRRRFVHVDEGAYDETEDAIRGLLEVGADSPRAAPVEP